MSSQCTPIGYRLDFKPGDPCYYTPEQYEIERQAGYDGADIWGLFPEPQPFCPPCVEVYKGWCWVPPRYVSSVRDLSGFTPLYRGQLIQRAPMDEDVLHVFPSLVESRLQEERPDLYPPKA